LTLKYFVNIVVLIFQYPYLLSYQSLYVLIYCHFSPHMRRVIVSIEGLF